MTKRKPEPDVVSLLAHILENRPNLPAALCVGRHELFDRVLHPEPGTTPFEQQEARLGAEALCGACTHRRHCPTNLAPQPVRHTTPNTFRMNRTRLKRKPA